MAFRPADSFAEVVLLDVHVEEVAHHLDRSPNGLAEFDRLLHAVQHMVLVAVGRLEQHERSLAFGVLPELLQRFEQYAPVFLLRAGHLEGWEPLGGEAESRQGDRADATKFGYAGEQALHVLDRLAATAGVKVPDKAVGDQAHAREHDALLPGGPQLIEPLEPVFRAAQLDAVEAGGARELPLLENAFARKDVFLTRQLHRSSSPTRGAPLGWGYG